MVMLRQQNPNGTYGKCSCAKIGDFKIGDRVQLVMSHVNPKRIGSIGTIMRIASYTRELEISWETQLTEWPGGGREMIAPQAVRKL